MDKLIKFAITTAIAALLMYVIGFVIMLIIFIIISIVIWLWKLVFPTPEWTDWKKDEDGSPIVTFNEKGERVYQGVTWWVRQNNKTGEWENKKVVDTVKRRIEDATGITNILYINKRFYNC